MSEQLFRQNDDGDFEPVDDSQGRSTHGIDVRLNPSKAAAFNTWMAQGGGTKKSGRFRKGPMAGMGVDEAKQKFNGMWRSAPDSVKEKYAGMTDNDLAPRERTAATLPNLGQQGNRMRQQADAKAKRMAFYGKP